ncbi:MAG: phenylalanine--tRNA ligase subunit beta [Nitrospinae bacterium]|jgi:phenylalanyl-tRNA synthetase beta chain|nr:phenylalanine--tRNA ligase subunit beta [Nitrospinota bacterium]MDA1109662.1 phenylalanine--tRNA ligase subunit beta [Nitrospinota bacterium]
MLIQLDWLKEYVEFDVPTEELAEILSMGGLEIEALDWVALPDGTKTQVMEVNVTPNRGYCLSYRGMAREVAALLGKTCQWDDPEQELEQSWGPNPVEQKLSVENREETLCPRYMAMVIENVTPGPSPKWLVDRLLSMGLRSINNIVDVTNYVMFETGQPLHAFDRDLLAGFQVVIRRAHKNEAFISLDKSNLVLGEDALVIADAEKPVALAGIMGGANSEVSGSTRTVVLESAYFDPVIVRKGSKEYGIRTDSSFRFERTVDIAAVRAAQSRAALLIRQLAGGEICRGRIDLYPHPKPLPSIDLRVSRVNQILGLNLSGQVIGEYLERLGISSEPAQTGETLILKIPESRPTLEREIDVIEEIARLHGFENVEVAHPQAEIIPVKVSRRRQAVQTVKTTLCHLGYAEAINYSFIDSKNADSFRSAFGTPQAESINLRNPLSNEWATMRTSLIPGLLSTAARNLSKGQKPVKIFELGDIYFKGASEKPAVEKTCFSALVVGAYEPDVWKAQTKSYDFFDLKGSLETVLSQLKLSVEFYSSPSLFLTPGKSVDCFIAGRKIGYFGEVSSNLIRQWDIGRPAYVFEIDFGQVVEALPDRPRFVPIPKFPETYRDISLIVDEGLPSKEIHDLIVKTSAPLIRRVDLYDYFEGKKIEQGKKSLTFSLAFQSTEKTLTDEEVNPVFEKIVQTLSEKLGAKLRE